MDHWREFDNRALLFHRQKSGLPLLDVSDGDLMAKIYKDNGSGWIKIGVVRDPITRLLSAYLDLVLTRQKALSSDGKNSGGGGHRDRRRRRRSRRRSLLVDNDDDEEEEEDELAWLDGVGRHQQQQQQGVGGGRGEEFKEKDGGVVGHGEGGGGGGVRGREGRDVEGTGDVVVGDSAQGYRNSTRGRALEVKEEVRAGAGAAAAGKGRGGGRGHHAVVPTFPEVVDALVWAMAMAPLAFKPMSDMCGMRLSPFDTVIPFETLQVCRDVMLLCVCVS